MRTATSYSIVLKPQQALNRAIKHSALLASALGLCIFITACAPLQNAQLSTTSSTSTSSPNSALACAQKLKPQLVSNDKSTTSITAIQHNQCTASGYIKVLTSGAQTQSVLYQQAKAYTDYTLNVTAAGLYQFNLNIQAKKDTQPALKLIIDNQPAAQVTIKSQGSYNAAITPIYLKGGLQHVRIMATQAGAQLNTLSLTSLEDNTLTPQQLVDVMGTGINLGNTLDEPAGQDWGAQKEQEHYFDAFKAAGFGHVRIPITWGGRTAEVAPYTVDPEWMDRVEKTVDWALERGFIVIINAHHERWLKEQYTEQRMQRLEAIWTQLMARFQYKPKRLIFELLNEPHGMTMAQTNAANVRILNIVRATNPTHSAVFSGNGYTPYDALIAADIPDDKYLIGNFHSYNPWEFGGQCKRRWGTAEDKAQLRDIYQQVANWSAKHNVPATVNEFAAARYDWENPENICNLDDRTHYFKAHIESQKEFGIPGTIWDDDGSFRFYDRKTGTWDNALKSLVL